MTAANTCHEAAYRRRTYARSALQAIGRSVGLYLSVEVTALLRDQRLDKDGRQAVAARRAAREEWLVGVRERRRDQDGRRVDSPAGR